MAKMTGRLVRMPDDLWEQIGELAEKSGETRSEWIRQRLTKPEPVPRPEAKAPSPVTKRKRAPAKVAPRDCVHPVSRRIGDNCGVCLKPAR